MARVYISVTWQPPKHVRNRAIFNGVGSDFFDKTVEKFVRNYYLHDCDDINDRFWAYLCRELQTKKNRSIAQKNRHIYKYGKGDL